MLIPKRVFEVSKIAARESTRYAINGVLVERDDEKLSAVCTNGRTLLKVDWSDEHSRTEYPGKNKELNPQNGFKAVINAEDWTEAAKLAPKRSIKPILENVVLNESGKGSITLSATDLQRRRSIEVTPSEGHFPKYLDVIPVYRVYGHDTQNLAESDAIQIGIDPKLLSELLTTMTKIATCEEARELRLVVPKDPHKPILLTCQSEGVKATGVLMPVNLRAIE